ncbi:MAG: pseudouridine synthase [Candidatus Scatosoma sp.]
MSDKNRQPYTRKKEASREAAKNAVSNARKAEKYTAHYTVPRSDTLLSFLLKKCKQSRNNVKALLSGGKVLVNGRAEKQFDFPLAKDDEIKIAKNAVFAPFTDERAARAESCGKTRGASASAKRAHAKDAAVRRAPQLNVLFEDGDFLVVDKPAGLLSVESDDERFSAYYLAEEYLRGKGKGERAYVLHRIDKETSGVLAFAKNVKLHSALRMHWNELVQKREYYAVVSGVMKEKSGEIVSYLKEDGNHLVHCVARGEGKRAVTKYETLKENGEFSLLRVEIESGRKNQIRVAMKAAGHPVTGDEKYGYVPSPLNRLGLHASALCVKHPVTGETLSFYSPVPRAMTDMFGKNGKKR